MHDIVCFAEDSAHCLTIGALARRIAGEISMEVDLHWRSARGGHGRVISEFRTFLRDLKRQGGQMPDLIIIATDANCKGLGEKLREIDEIECPIPLVRAIPDPHVERWLLLDGAAFKAVLGKGCDAPDQKCDRDRYKELLIRAVLDADIVPNLGGIEFAEDIVAAMDLSRAARSDRSLYRFLDELRRALRGS